MLSKTLSSIQLLLVLIISLTLNACAGRFNSYTESLTIGSFSSDLKFSQALYKNFKKHNRVKITLLSIHPDKAEKALLEGKIDAFIGTLAKENSTLNQELIAKSVLTPVINQENRINSVNKSDLKKILNREIINWSKFTENDKKILLINNNDFYIESTLRTELGINSFKNLPLHNVSNDGDLAKLVLKHPNAFGIINFQNTNPKLKILKIDNINLNQENFKIAYIPLKRNIYLYEPRINYQQKPYRSLHALKHFLRSTETQTLITQMNLAPLSSAEMQLNQREDSIKIGVGLPLGASNGELYLNHLNSIQYLADKFNHNHQLNNKRIELIVCDDKGQINAALDCAKLFVKEKVKAVIGHINSEISIETSKIYLKHNITQVSPCSTHPWFTQREENKGSLFRIMSADKIQAETIANAIKKLSKNKKIIKILLLDNNKLFSNNLSSQIKSCLFDNKIYDIKQKSVSEKETSRFQFSHRDEYDFLVFIGSYNQAEELINKLNKLRSSSLIFIGSDGSNFKAVINKRTKFPVYLVGSNVSDTESPDLKEYNEALFRGKHSRIFGNEVHAYDAALVLFTAIEACENGEYQKISDALHSKKFHSLGRDIQFSSQGDPLNSTYAVYNAQTQEKLKI